MCRAPLAVPVLVLIVGSVPATAETPRGAADTAAVARSASVRTADRRLRTLIDRGARTSPTFRALLARLDRSDVVVYVQCEAPVRPGLAGRLTFVSAAGGYRYVLVRVVAAGSTAQQIAILAHELRHAVEIADAPQVVDVDSLAHEYRRIGHLTRAQDHVVAFDSDAAVEAGYQVLAELLRQGE